MSTFKEVMATFFAVFGIIAIVGTVGAVGSIETDKWLQGGLMAMLGATMFMLALYSQELYKEAK